jgi:hypothetical protein
MPEAIPSEGCTSDLETRVRALERMKLPALRDIWTAEWGLPPKLRSAALLRMIIAWRLQAAAEGGLASTTRIRLRTKSIPRAPLPPPGTFVTREYRGIQYSVEIRDGYVTYGGRTYRSLSEVAREITGTRWNGPRFFGLRPGSLS